LELSYQQCYSSSAHSYTCMYPLCIRTLSDHLELVVTHIKIVRYLNIKIAGQFLIKQKNKHKKPKKKPILRPLTDNKKTPKRTFIIFYSFFPHLKMYCVNIVHMLNVMLNQKDIELIHRAIFTKFNVSHNYVNYD
jgi:hypothetical protein